MIAPKDRSNILEAAGIADRINWELLQNNADEVLFDGIKILLQGQHFNFEHAYPNDAGNYLISYLNKPVYIGESLDLANRIKQQGKIENSTFYKNYLSYNTTSNIERELKISDFHVQFIKTKIGRKEAEEFGIVNLPVFLNKFHKDKQKLVTQSKQTGLWEDVQNKADLLLEQADCYINSLKPIQWLKCNPNSLAGIYIIKDPQDELIYIGETTNLLERYNTHTKKTRFSALRRNIARQIFSFKLKSKLELGIKSSDKKKGFLNEKENNEINNYLSECKVIMQIVSFGRLEFEEYMIKKYRPLLNRKGNIDE